MSARRTHSLVAGLLVIAGSTAVSSSFLGVYISFFLNASTGACIVLLQAAIFLLTLFFAPKHGLLAAKRQRLMTGPRTARVG